MATLEELRVEVENIKAQMLMFADRVQMLDNLRVPSLIYALIEKVKFVLVERGFSGGNDKPYLFRNLTDAKTMIQIVDFARRESLYNSELLTNDEILEIGKGIFRVMVQTNNLFTVVDAYQAFLERPDYNNLMNAILEQNDESSEILDHCSMVLYEVRPKRSQAYQFVFTAELLDQYLQEVVPYINDSSLTDSWSLIMTLEMINDLKTLFNSQN